MKLKPQAKRLDTLDGKTIYFVNDGYIRIGYSSLDNDGLVQEQLSQDQRHIQTQRRHGICCRGSGSSRRRSTKRPMPWSSAWGIEVSVRRRSSAYRSSSKLKYGKPAVPLVIYDFAKQEAEVAATHGMPGLRIQFFRGPVWAKTADQLRRQIVEGNNPITGKPVMQELVLKLTTPLTDAEKRTGELKRDNGPATFTDTSDNLQQMFLEKRWTDFLPVILPTEEKVDEMLKATSHLPEEALGKIAPTGGVFEAWSYTVRTAAINAVMAGCKPEYLPLILAVGHTGMEGISVSDNGFVSGLVINGKIRDEIGLNYEIGAMGPFAHANTTIGRAWNLLSINGGNCGKVGTTYMGTVGNPMDLINIVIAENERDSPLAPFSTRVAGKGYKRGPEYRQPVQRLGRAFSKNWNRRLGSPSERLGRPKMNYPQIIKDIFNDQCPRFSEPARSSVRLLRISSKMRATIR